MAHPITALCRLFIWVHHFLFLRTEGEMASHLFWKSRFMVEHEGLCPVTQRLNPGLKTECLLSFLAERGFGYWIYLWHLSREAPKSCHLSPPASSCHPNPGIQRRREHALDTWFLMTQRFLIQPDGSALPARPQVRLSALWC